MRAIQDFLKDVYLASYFWLDYLGWLKFTIGSSVGSTGYFSSQKALK